MTRERFLFLAGTAAAVFLMGSIVWAQARADVSGVWTFTVESAAGTSTPTVTFKQEGEKLTGHYSSALVGEAELAGTVKGQTINFVVSVDVQGTKLQLTYTGTIEGKDSMKGKLSLGELGDGTFSAKRN